MVCSSVALGLILWMVMQFGSQTVLMAALDAGYALKGPMINIQSYLETEWPDSSLRMKRAVRTLPHIDGKEMEAAVQFAQSNIEKMALHETNIADADVVVKAGTPGEGQLIESLPTPEALSHSNDAMVALKASIHLANKYCFRMGIDDAFCAKQISDLSLLSTSLGKKCMNHYKNNLYCSELNTFRSIDGSCNHKTHSAWGRSLTPYRRLLPAQYEDSFHSMRGSRKGRPLSSPRSISTAIVQNLDQPDWTKTLAAMQWGQFVAHDVAHTVTLRMLHNGKPISCCSHNGMKLSPRHRHAFCAPIDVSRDDPFYGELWKTCMPYVRSVIAMRPDCTFGPVDQMNQATHYLDGSVIYGSTNEVSASLRTFQNGRLRTEVREEKEFLPSFKQPNGVCATNNSCYHSGDVRMNIYPGLAALHTLWVREHNRISERLNIMNPMWDDERLFQEARRIVVAEIQHITYNEWLPVVLGMRYMKRVGLTINRKGYSAKFNEQIDASISNSFATAAMSFINSMVEGRLGLYKEDRNPQFTVLLKDFYNKPSMLEEDSRLDELVRGLATQSSQRMDLHYSDAVTNYLYKSKEGYGLDILSLDIQRGIDHGLASYNEFRGLCGLPKAEDFADFSDTIPMEIISKLRKLYKNVDEVDLIIGGMAETHEEGLVGPTFKCIISEQFVRTRTGDRFFYDIGGQAGSLTEAQLREIKKSNLARVFCDNSDNIMNMQPYVFHKPATPNNDLVPCGEITLIDHVDLEPWRESPTPSLLP